MRGGHYWNTLGRTLTVQGSVRPVKSNMHKILGDRWVIPSA